MIRYTLKCDKSHVFDSWFKSAEAFDKLKSAKMVTCETCGSPQVEKSLMAPGVPKKANALKDIKPTALEELRKEVEANSEYVGSSFAVRAKDMHDGIEPVKSIYGEAKPHEVKSLVEEGVPVMPLPFVPKKKTN